MLYRTIRSHNPAVVWYKEKTPKKGKSSKVPAFLSFPFLKLLRSWQIIFLCREGFVSDPGSLRKKFVIFHTNIFYDVWEGYMCHILSNIIVWICSSIFCASIWQLSPNIELIWSCVQNAWYVMYSIYSWNLFEFLYMCMGCPRPSAPFHFAQFRQIKLNQIAALSPNCRGTCALIFCIFNTDLQSSPFSIPPLFDRQAGAKLWIHIYIWIFLKYSNPSFISSIRIHHKIRTKALSFLCHRGCCRARGQLEPLS